jgi:hypothetical protein
MIGSGDRKRTVCTWRIVLSSLPLESLTGPGPSTRIVKQSTNLSLPPEREKMRAIQKAVGCLLALLLLAACAAAAQKTKQIQIGTFVFHGTTDPNCGQFCNAGYEVIIDTSVLTGDVLSFGDITVAIGTISQSSGPEAMPIDLVFVGGPSPFVLPDCAKVPCRSIDLQLTSNTGKPFSLTLLDGSTFTTYAVNTITIKALPGQHVVKPEQSVPIILVRDAGK